MFSLNNTPTAGDKQIIHFRWTMKMRNAGTTLLLLSSIASQAMASENKEHDYKLKPSISAGYEWGEVQGLGKLNGGNLKIDLFPDAPVGLMFSTSLLKDKWDEKDKSKKGITDIYGNRIKSRYFSAMLGPTLKVNDVVSLYGLMGGSWVGLKNTHDEFKNKLTKPNFTYGYGVIFNITDNFVVSGGYERSMLKFGRMKSDLDGYMINMGYRF